MERKISKNKAILNKKVKREVKTLLKVLLEFLLNIIFRQFFAFSIIYFCYYFFFLNCLASTFRLSKFTSIRLFFLLII